jgi:hypothetical protein
MNTKLVFRGLLAAVAALIVLSGCPNPITDQTFLQMVDRNPPTVDISSPAGGTPYTQTVTVQGTAIDGEGRLKGIAWIVTGALGLLEEGTIPASGIGTDGSFSFQFSTLTYSGPIGVTVKATDWNDNVGTTVVTLSEPDGQLSSLTALPANKQVTLDWDEVDGAIYTVYYTTNGTLPSESYGEQVAVAAPPFVVSGLKNGAMHVFLLKATADGEDYWSGYIRAIPLSPFTLAPEVNGGYRELILEWASIDATDEFEVWRSASAEGPFTNHTGIIRGTTWTDSGVPDDVWFYYKVRPAIEGGLLSTYGAGQTVPLPQSALERITSLATPGSAAEVKVLGDYAYIAARTGGLVVVDISDIRVPSITATRPTTNALDIELYDGCAYVSDGTGGLKVFDISNPAAPVQIGSTTSGEIGNATRIAVAGGPNDTNPYARAYVVDSSGGSVLRVYDIATPASPTLLSTYAEPGYNFRDVTAAYFPLGSYWTFVYASAIKTGDPNMGSGIVFESYTDPSDDHQSIVSWRDYVYPNPDQPSNHWRPFHLALSGSQLYATSDLGASTGLMFTKLLVLNRYPSSLSLAGEATDIVGMPSGLAAGGTRAYASNSTGLQVYDVSTPAAPVALDYWDMPGVSEGVTLDATGGHAFVVSGVLGFHVVDLAAQPAPSVAGTWTVPAGQGYNGLAVQGGLAYIAASGPPSMRILDVSDPAAVSERGSIALGSPSAIAVSGDWAFVVSGSAADGLAVVDISNPSTPVLRGTTPLLGGSGLAIEVRGDHAYVAGGNGLQIFDIGDPMAPVPVGFFDAEVRIAGVDVRTARAYVTDGSMFMISNKLRIVDVSRSSAPSLIDATPNPDFTIDPAGVAVQGSYAFIADSNPVSGLFAVNVDSSSTNYLDHWALCNTKSGDFGSARDVAVCGDRAYVADSSTGTGLAVVDITDLGTPGNTFDPDRLLAGVSWANATAKSVVLSGRFAFVTDSNGMSSMVGLKIVRIIP